MFSNREEAGRMLLEKLLPHCCQIRNGLVLAIPRGGVVVAEVIAKGLGFPLDVVIPRKIGAPGNPEFGLGAVALDGTLYLNPEAARLKLPQGYLERETEIQKKEIESRMKMYRGDREEPEVQKKHVFLVDDGVATGSTVFCAVQWLKKGDPQKVWVAAPVIASDTLRRLERKVDHVVYVEAPRNFYAVGQFYRDFRQTTHEEVVKILSGSVN